MSWQATYVEALRQSLAWANTLQSEQKFGIAEACILHLGFAEYGAQLAGGIAMSQTEIIRPADMGVASEDIARFASEPALAVLSDRSAIEKARKALVNKIAEGHFGALALERRRA